MNYPKMCGLAGVAAMVSVALFASSASATTLEVGGVAKNESVTLTVSEKSGTSAVLKDTAGLSSNTCTSSHEHGSGVIPSTGDEIVIALTPAEGGLSFSNCARTVQVHKSGSLSIKWTSGTNGTVSSSEAEITTGSAFGTLTCKTGAKTHLGTLTGVSSGHAAIHVNAVLTCSGISSKWEAEWVITSPTGLGVVN